MTLIYGTGTTNNYTPGSPDAGNKDGAGTTNYNLQSFYGTQSNWNGYPWKIEGSTYYTVPPYDWGWSSGNLPILNNMPGSPAQNPSVTP